VKELNDDIGLPFAYAVERVHEVIVAHAGTDVNVADLRQPRAVERRRQVIDRQVELDELQPVRLDADGISDTASARYDNCRGI
jgi:hypothetical protein